MLIGARQVQSNKKALPYDAEVEYLESTGEQWIDTGITPGTNTTVETLVTTTVTSQDIPIFGSVSTSIGSGALQYHLTPYSSKWYWGSNEEQEHANGTYTPIVGRTWHILFNSNRKIIVNGAVLISSVNIKNPLNGQTLAISFRKGSNGARSGQWKYSYFKIYESGTLVRDLISVRIRDVGYMYDRVSETLFSNAGTGGFVVGRDVSN